MKQRVLVVDDDDVMQRVLQAVFKSQAETKVVSSVAEAVVALASFQPDLIVSDNIMPGESGLLFLEGLAREGHPARRVLFSASEPESVRALLRAGTLVAFVKKPATLEELQGLLRA
ncbi:MAG: response regulator [Myxococcota bacterium]